MQLLIVEGNHQMRRLIRSILARVASQISECAHGDEAPEAYARLRPDFVLMDMDIAPVHGIAAMLQIRRSDPAAKIVVVSGDDSPDLREAARLAGAWEFVRKDNLLELIRILEPEANSPCHST